MYDIYFDDYINLYKKINTEEWITLFEENETKNYEDDIFTFCAIIDRDKLYENDYMQKLDWGFATESFGKSGFGSYSSHGEEEIYFNSGEMHDEFEYLIALRYFDKYERIVEINPKLIWYYNLVKTDNGYVNPITDEQIIKVKKHKIEVRREYLKDFLCAYNMACVIVFDHRRYFNKDVSTKYNFQNICDANVFLNLNITSTREFGTISQQYDLCSCIIGKAVITPYKKPQHEDYKYYAEQKEFEKFIVDFDEDDGEILEFTCNEDSLANYFGANPDAPHFLTPIYFNIKVLDKYKNDPRDYEITDSNISFLSHWSIPFNINEENKVVVWLGDLGRIPYGEQKYWKAFNEKTKGGIEKKFFQRQIMSTWTDASRIESKVVPTLNKFNEFINNKYGDIVFSKLSEADSQIYSTFMLPTNLSIPEYQSYLMKLCKLIAESINVKLFKTVMANDYNSSIGSVLQLGDFLKYTGIDVNGTICGSIKKAYDSRNKLAGHRASFGEYNKVWGRSKDYKFNTIEDARELLENIIGSIEYSINSNQDK
jgi:hypothetical protein